MQNKTKTNCHPELCTLSNGEGAKKEILRSAQNDRGKSIGHYEEQSDVVIPSNNEIATPMARNDRGKYTDNKTSSLNVGGVKSRAAEHKKILKQMTPEQKVALGGARQNTSRTVYSGSLKQL